MSNSRREHSKTEQPVNKIGQRIKQHGIIAIVRGNYPLDEILEIGDALLVAQIQIMEVTLNSAGALEAIAALRRRFGGELVVGAGTVRTVEQFDAAIGAGAQFSVAPNFDRATVESALARDIVHLPGVFTATEVQTAFAAGCRMVKLFPSNSVGPGYLKALRAPLNDVEFVPTGGISVDNIADYAKAGAVAVGMGGSLIPKEWSREAIIATGRALRKAWDEARGEKWKVGS